MAAARAERSRVCDPCGQRPDAPLEKTKTGGSSASSASGGKERKKKEDFNITHCAINDVFDQDFGVFHSKKISLASSQVSCVGTSNLRRDFSSQAFQVDINCYADVHKTDERNAELEIQGLRHELLGAFAATKTLSWASAADSYGSGNSGGAGPGVRRARNSGGGGGPSMASPENSGNYVSALHNSTIWAGH